jgi:hypothetical protein
MKSHMYILFAILLSGCIETPPDSYCGCPEYKLLGHVKHFDVNVNFGLFAKYPNCKILLDNNNEVFMEDGLCMYMASGKDLYKSTNRETFYALCDSNKTYPIKDKCEYEISDISDAALNIQHKIQ